MDDKISKIGIQCNGSVSIGMGHVMRTMVLAEELRKKYQVFYICKSGEEYKPGVSLIERKGYQVFYEEDNIAVDFLILDSYGVSGEALSGLRTKYGKLMYIDDLNELDYYDCDILLNRNLDAEKLIYNTAKDCKVLLGTKYALLRNEFRHCYLPTVKEQVKNILITMGGTDPYGTSVKVLSMIKELPYCFKVVVGSGYAQNTMEELRMLGKDRVNIELHYNPNMAELMCQCDLAITACGGTIQELAALGVPQLAVSVAPNQESGNNKENGLFLYAGNEKKLQRESFLNLLNYLIDSYEARYKLSESEKSLVNRDGIQLVIEEMGKL